jgi:hypothetical protein
MRTPPQLRGVGAQSVEENRICVAGGMERRRWSFVLKDAHHEMYALMDRA